MTTSELDQICSPNLKDFKPYFSAADVASIATAAKSHPQVLSRLLDHGRNLCGDPHTQIVDLQKFLSIRNKYGPNNTVSENPASHNSLLLQAIRSQRPKNVKILLQAGVNPNGVPLEIASANTASLLRFGLSFEDPYEMPWYNREDVLFAIGCRQLFQNTSEEIEDRYEDCTARFWSEISSRSFNEIDHGDTIPAVVEAAQGPSVEILDQVYAAKSDCSFWLSDPPEMPIPATVSSLAVASPLHAAIWARTAKDCYLPIVARVRFECHAPSGCNSVHLTCNGCDPIL